MSVCMEGGYMYLESFGVSCVLFYTIIQNLSHSIIFNLAFSSLDMLLFLGELKLFSNEFVNPEGE